MGAQALEVLVTGVGRSGTGFMAKLLTMNGVECGHESVFGVNGVTRNGGLIWHPNDRPSESSWLAAPLVQDLYHNFGYVDENTKIIHVVRNPYKVVQSIWGIGTLDLTDENPIRRYVAAVLPSIFADEVSPVMRAAKMALKWNNIIEIQSSRHPNYRIHRVEDDPKGLEDFLGINIRHVPDNRTNSRRPYPILPEEERWQWIRPVMELAARYDYLDDLRWLWG